MSDSRPRQLAREAGMAWVHVGDLAEPISQVCEFGGKGVVPVRGGLAAWIPGATRLRLLRAGS